jgi:hypothetical protein
MMVFEWLGKRTLVIAQVWSRSVCKFGVNERIFLLGRIASKKKNEYESKKFQKDLKCRGPEGVERVMA